MVTNDIPECICFGGCSWACCYYIGVYKALINHFGNKVWDIKLAGNSAGSLFALGMALRKTPYEMEIMYKRLSNQAQLFGVFNKVSIYHHSALDLWLDESNTYSLVNGKLFIGMTKFPGEFIIKSNWTSNQDLLNTLHASMHIPWYCSYIEPVDGCWYIDGGFTKNVFKPFPKTLTVSPITSTVDIHPDRLIKMYQCIYPISEDKIQTIIQLGEQNLYKKISNSLNRKHLIRKKNSFWYKSIKKIFLLILWINRMGEYIMAKHFKKSLIIFLSYFLAKKSIKNLFANNRIHGSMFWSKRRIR